MSCYLCEAPAMFNEKLQRYIRECQEHHRIRIERDRKRRAVKRNVHQCVSCDSPSDADSIYCTLHRQRHSDRMKRRRNENRLIGTCVECGDAVIPESVRCQVHIEQQRVYINKIDNLPPSLRRHYSRYCGICGVFQTKSSESICTVCNDTRTQCIEYVWHEALKKLAHSYWPPSSSTFSQKTAFGTRQCKNERLIYSDMVFILDDRLIVLECDEFAHEDQPVDCELARMDSMQFGAPTLLPIVILRMNPHDMQRRCIYSDFNERLTHFWSLVEKCFTDTNELERVTVYYHGYPADSAHVHAARNQSRFNVIYFP